MPADNEYALGGTPQEYARLVRQSEIFGPMTQRVFEDAGIAPGLDLDSDAVKHARGRASAAGFTNIEFIHGSFADYNPATKVDAIVGRLVLLYQPDPSASLAAVIRHLRPGGIVAFLELWLQPPQEPDSNIRRAGACIVETMRRSGAHLDVRPRLHRIFAAAGLPVPFMRGEIPMDGRAGSPRYRYFADTLGGVLPKAIEYGVASPGEFDLESLPARAQAEMQAVGYAMLAGPIVAAWCRSQLD